jgi:hypothetical protein
MTTLLQTVSVLSALATAGDPASAVGAPAQDVCYLGDTRLVFPSVPPVPHGGPFSRAIYQPWGRLAGAPFRDGVWLDVPGKGLPLGSIADAKAAAGVDWQTVGYFLRRIESPRHLEKLLRVLRHPPRGEWLTAGEVGDAVRAVAKLGPEYGMRVVATDVDASLLQKGCFESGGIWFADFVAIGPADWLVEYKYAVDSRNRVARVRRVIVEGPPPPIANGLFMCPTLESIASADPGGRRSQIEYVRANQWAYRRVAVLSASARLQRMVAGLADRDALVRSDAVRQLGTLGVLAKDATPGLPDPLGDTELVARWAAATARTGLGEKVKGVIPNLAAALHDSDGRVRPEASAALAAMGPAAIPDLKKAAEGADGNAAYLAREALRQIEEDATYPLAR